MKDGPKLQLFSGVSSYVDGGILTKGSQAAIRVFISPIYGLE